MKAIYSPRSTSKLQIQWRAIVSNATGKKVVSAPRRQPSSPARPAFAPEPVAGTPPPSGPTASTKEDAREE